MVVNLQGLYKYGSKYTCSQTNIQENIGGAYKRIRKDGIYIREGTVGVYIREGKDMRTLHSNDQTYLWDRRGDVSLTRASVPEYRK